ncbi:MAG: methyltransferase domain-containing protein [Bradyrhizobiaceae bacterium]|nr:methyltransferase domain-containing protein [Bradyrhizobiaceae bacterium]
MDKQKIRAFTDRLFADMAGAMTAGMAYVGVRTGLFRAMAGKGPMRLDDVVRESKLKPRYVEEWLRGMTSAGYLAYDPARETYALPDEHAYLLASDGTDHFVGGLFAVAPVMLRAAPEVAAAFEKGGGVRFEDIGADGVHGLDLINRGNYEHRLASYWLQAMPNVVRALEAGGRVLDVGCGAGRVCIAVARAFPKAEVSGIDPDAESIRQAKEAAAAEGLGDRIRFLAQTTTDTKADGGFDLVTLCDALHDLAAPQETLAEIRALLKPEGTLFIIEPKAADQLKDNVNPVATMFYGFSLFHCMTQSLARGGPGLGTCLGPARTEELVRAAGFRQFDLLGIKSQVNLFYAARP